MTDKKIDFLAIGDITTDAFIALQDATVNCDVDNENCTLCMSFGDKIPYKKVTVVRAVGNSPNASVSAARLGLNSAALTYVGDDQNGKECIESLEADGVITDFVQIEKGSLTNYHYVLLFDAERTILVKHTEFKYSIPEMPEPKWIYLSSLSDNSLPYHIEIAEYLKAHPDVKLAFQPGTFQIKMGHEKLKDLYEQSELFFCNKQEAQRILHTDEDDINKLLEGIHNLGPKIAIITDGPGGAYTFDGEEIWYTPMYPDAAPPVDRTGAGDSFASTFTVALAQGKSIPEALSWGPVNSMSVVQYIGAQKGLLSKDALEGYLKDAPDSYKVKKIN
ncbi:hypothetical protein COB64_03100 [Candidatus Wolfebacteria bacterium]|nr:MAG: hypothetical protein COB64_03100 [Candidatus Wolfebacteria bacterium]